MSVYRRFDAEGLPSLVTTNTRDRTRIFASAGACRLLVRTIYEVRAGVEYRLLAFAIMPDHVHLLVAAPSLGRLVQLIKGRFARAYNVMTGGSGAVWQSRYHERTLRTEEALYGAIEYVHNNPVVAELASDPENYAWSTATGKFVTDLHEYLGQAEA